MLDELGRTVGPVADDFDGPVGVRVSVSEVVSASVCEAVSASACESEAEAVPASVSAISW